MRCSPLHRAEHAGAHPPLEPAKDAPRPKSAQRLAFWLVKAPPEDAKRLAQVIVQAKERIFFCQECGNVAEGDLCHICLDERRDGRPRRLRLPGS